MNPAVFMMGDTNLFIKSQVLWDVEIIKGLTLDNGLRKRRLRK